jgi:integrase
LQLDVDIIIGKTWTQLSVSTQRDPTSPANRGAYLLGKATDLHESAPWAAQAQGEVDPKGGIVDSTLYGQLKGFFTECAKQLDQNDEAGAKRSRAASTHWLRHTHASHWIARGTPVEIAQQNLGHASLATTTVYVTTEQKRRMKAIQGGWQKGRVVT